MRHPKSIARGGNWARMPHRTPPQIVPKHGGGFFILIFLDGDSRIMSDLANVSSLTRTPVHLPVSWYFDPKIAEVEQQVLFRQGPGYVGHELMVPESGDYRSLEAAESRQRSGP